MMIQFAWHVLLRILVPINGYQIMNQSRVANVDEQTEFWWKHARRMILMCHHRSEDVLQWSTYTTR
jgi:hypothetical protein